MLNKAVFLDRDGTLNNTIMHLGRPSPPKNTDEFEILPYVPEAILQFKELGFIPVVVTNQPDFARGDTSLSQIEVFNEIIKDQLQIEHVYMCLHDDLDECSCRKPQPGLLLNAALDLKIDTKQSIMVGDRWKDIAAGQAAGSKCFFIDNSYDEGRPLQPFHRVSSLIDVISIIRRGNDY
jgi:D-glycero-D-manno-heptose 1,7-bisphosphate phosphatase